ncbi:MAG: OmpA family protein [Sterolibacteriaceae bacterium]|jgi:outer membrane protein OmpA-like peptidoglycan-associated protein|nr:OmpA family protein [Sterolibacteriaceae bacterium]MBK9083713.1 OmpA family protein [Sterolibacteriaceae bacterium]
MRWALILVLAMLTAACAGQRPFFQFMSKSAGRERITLLPGADGKVGKVIVSAGESRVTLDSAYATAEIRGGTVSKGEADQEASRARIEVALAALPRPPRKFTVFYQLDQSTLTPDSKQDLEAIRHYLANVIAPEVVVTGHADRLGPMAYNDELSLRRAKQIRQVLVEAGIPGDRIQVIARGEREPLIATPDNLSEPHNRRVEIKLR